MPYLRIRPTSLIVMATTAHFASPLATDRPQCASHFKHHRVLNIIASTPFAWIRRLICFAPCGLG